jgi:hypothetical protein
LRAPRVGRFATFADLFPSATVEGVDPVFEKLLDWLGGSVVALLLGAVVVRVRDLWRKRRLRPSGDRGERVTVWDAYPTDTGPSFVFRSITTRAAEPLPDVPGPLWILKSGPPDPRPADPVPAGLLAALDEAAYTDPHFPQH